MNTWSKEILLAERPARGWGAGHQTPSSHGCWPFRNLLTRDEQSNTAQYLRTFLSKAMTPGSEADLQEGLALTESWVMFRTRKWLVRRLRRGFHCDSRLLSTLARFEDQEKTAGIRPDPQETAGVTRDVPQTPSRDGHNRSNLYARGP